MAVTNSFRNAVTAGDIRGIRIMIKDSLLVDLTFREFNEMNSLAQDIVGLYVPHDGRNFECNKSAWNDNYMNKMMVQVVGNFSRERISHLKEVVSYLRPVVARQQTQTARNSNHTNDENNRRIIVNRSMKIAVGAAAGGAVGGVIASIVGATVVIGVATGAVVVGAAVIIATNGDR